jgi:hypothetical protein
VLYKWFSSIVKFEKFDKYNVGLIITSFNTHSISFQGKHKKTTRLIDDDVVAEMPCLDS